MDIFAPYVKALANKSMWGPFLILVGAFFLFSIGTRVTESSKVAAANYVAIGAAIFLCLSGVAMMFHQLRGSTELLEANERPESYLEADYVIRQLSQNYQILRSQTGQGFWLSGVFMTIGMLVIVVSLFGTSFGLQSTGINLATLSGILLEFISGTALLIYRLNFKRLNETSDKLDDSWRILTAYDLTEKLPEDKKAEATLKLIEALARHV